MYCISLNNSRGQLLFFRTKGGDYSWEGAIIQGKQLFQILLTGSHPYIYIIISFCPIKSKHGHIK